MSYCPCYSILQWVWLSKNKITHSVQCHAAEILQNCTVQNEKEDARKLGERNWRNAASNTDSWQKLLKKDLAQKGLL